MSDQPPSKAELAAAARASRRAVQEAAALRANLHRRKQQSRAQDQPTVPPVEDPAKPCR